MQTAEATIYPFLLPHFEIGPDGLYLGETLVCSLNEGERIYCKLCDGKHSLDQILRGLPEVTLPEEVIPYLLHLPDSIGAPVQKEEERILVIAPNPESAFMAMGGSLSMMKQKKVKMVVCFKRQTPTHLPELFSTHSELFAIRNDEAYWAAQLCGLDLQGLNYPAFALRHQSEGMNPDTERQIAAALKTALLAEIEQFQPQQIYAPAGIGEHPDHLMVHQLVLDIFKRNWFSDSRYFLYREYPYALDYSRIDETISRIETAFVSVKEQYVEIGAQADMQRNLMDLFFSLYDPSEASLLDHIRKRTAVEVQSPSSDASPTWEAFFELSPFDI